ncbi:MAG: SIR2 family protein [Desulfobacterales bacterium]
MSNLMKLNYRIKQDRYVLFLGAGASIESGGYTSGEIAFGILRRVYGVKPDCELQTLFETEYRRTVTFENVLGAFGTGKTDHKSLLMAFFTTMVPSDGYSFLAALLKVNIFYPIVLTTNFDYMLEDAIKNDKFIDKKVSVTVLVEDEVGSSVIAPRLDEIIIVKLHGDITKQESLRTSYKEYATLPENSENLIQKLCEENGVVVVGYRARDMGVRNSLERAKSSAKGIFWVTKDPLDEVADNEIYVLLEKHNSKSNIITGVTFDGVFRELGTNLVKVQFRKKYETELKQAWILINRARSFGAERHSILRELSKLSDKIVQETDLDEVLGLNEFIQYEIDRSGENYRLQQGVQLVENALNEYSGYMGEVELAEIEYALLGELLNLFLSGNQIPGGRQAHIERSINRGEALLQRVSKLRDQDLLKARCLIALGDAVKEKAMITEDTTLYISTYTSARKYCEKATTILKKLNGPEVTCLLGTAYRHTAVTYELEGDNATNDEDRKELYQQWQQLSYMAIEILDSVSEDRVRGYALMNLASSFTRLCDFEPNNWKKKNLLEEGKISLIQSISLLQKVEDHRGLGWAYNHLCENTRRRLDLIIDSDEKHTLLFDLEKHANKAIGELKRVDDHLAQGVGYEQLGISLYYVYKETGTAHIKLERAIRAIKEAVNLLQKTGFYRGAGEAFYWLSKCQFSLWEQTGKHDDLLAAIQALTQGIISTTTGLNTKDNIVALYHSLEDEIQKLL